MSSAPAHLLIPSLRRSLLQISAGTDAAAAAAPRRTKLKQTEMECEYLRRCFGSLTEENRRLQREVEQLRSLRVAPPTVLSPHTREPMLASALTMCPRCERVTTSGGATTPIAATAGGAASEAHARRPGLPGSFTRDPKHLRQPSAAC